MPKILTKNWALIIVLLLGISVSWPALMPGYFYHHDDLQVMRVFEMRKCFEDFQIPCRWIPDMGYGNGYPMFNYYSAFPYYLGTIFTYLFGFVGAAKVLFFIPAVISGLGMYWLAKELFGKWGGVVASGLYTLAPYRALDLYVRGAIAESFALALAPFIFYFTLKLIKENSNKNLLAAAICLGFFLMCHNIMTLFFMPILMLWIVFWVIKLRPKRDILIKIVTSLVLGIGMAAFFIFPAYFEKGLVNSESLKTGGTDFRAHYVTLFQLFLDRFWGYGASVFGSNDTISFQIGWPHWWLIIISGAILLFNFFKRKGVRDLSLFLFLLVVFGYSIFMSHNKSSFIWEKIDTLQYAQFPWRFLSLTIFSASLIGGLLVFLFKDSYQKWISILIIIVTLGFNWSFFRPKDFYPYMTDQIKLSDPLWDIQQKAGVNDYLPKTAYQPFGRAVDKPEIKEGMGQVSNFVNRSNQFKFDVKLTKAGNIEIPVFDFPNWVTFVNGKEINHSHGNLLGRIRLDLPTGDYQVSGKFTDTPIRTVSNLITLFSFLALIGIFIYGKRKAIN